MISKSVFPSSGVLPRTTVLVFNGKIDNLKVESEEAALGASGNVESFIPV